MTRIGAMWPEDKALEAAQQLHPRPHPPPTGPPIPAQVHSLQLVQGFGLGALEPMKR